MNSINNEFEICISSPPDRKNLVAEVFYNCEQIVELNQEKEKLMIEVYPKQNGLPWDIPFEEFLNSLNKAKKLLEGKN